MWILVVLMLGFPGGGGPFYVVEGSYPNRDACLTAQAKYAHRPLPSGRPLRVRTACLEVP